MKIARETAIYHAQKVYYDSNHPSTAARKKTTSGQTRGQCMAVIPHHGDPQPPTKIHCKKKRPARSRGKTPEETQQDYGAGVGYNNAYEVTGTGNKEDWWQDAAAPPRKSRKDRAHMTHERLRVVDERGHTVSRGTRKKYVMTEEVMAPAVRRGHKSLGGETPHTVPPAMNSGKGKLNSPQEGCHRRSGSWVAYEEKISKKPTTQASTTKSGHIPINACGSKF